MSVKGLPISWQDLTTERQNPLTEHIDELPTQDMLRLINAEDAKVAAAVEREIPAIARAVDAIAAALGNSGRLVYMGAGSSGRLGVLDASECPPTFGVEEGVVVALMAGGPDAMFRAKEGAEDDEALGRADLQAIGFGGGDVLVGLAASGRTPYVLGGVAHARSLGALTVALACTPDSALARLADIAISPAPGPEVITGSTRMKAGTAQKMVLNMLSTGVMIRLGKVYGNRMVDLRTSNEKLRGRARRMVAEVTGLKEQAAADLLQQAGGHAKTAICMALTGLGPDEASSLLQAHRGLLAQAVAAHRKDGHP